MCHDFVGENGEGHNLQRGKIRITENPPHPQESKSENLSAWSVGWKGG